MCPIGGYWFPEKQPTCFSLASALVCGLLLQPVAGDCASFLARQPSLLPEAKQ